MRSDKIMALETEKKEDRGAAVSETPESAQGEAGAGEAGEEAGEEEPEEEGGGGMGNFFSPEGIMMLLVAIVLDLASLILLFFALDDFFILDIIGLLTIGAWIFFRSQTVKMTKGTAARMRKKVEKVALKEISKGTKWGKRLKWLRPLMIVGEFVPYVGSAPCWTLLVYAELKA